MRASYKSFEDSGPCADDLRRIDYLPSPDDIASACESIRSAWSRNEQRRRFVGELVPDEQETAWSPPVIDTSQFRLSSAGGVDSSV